MQSIDLIEWKWKWNNIYAYGIRKDLVGEKEELKCNNINIHNITFKVLG